MFATAAPVAILMTPTQERLATGLGNRRSLAAAILVLWSLLIVAIPFTAILTLLGGQAVNFFSWLGPQLEPAKVQTFLSETLPSKIPWFGALWETVEPYVAPTAASLLSQISGAVQALLQRLATGLGATVIEISFFFLFLFFFLRDGRAILRSEERRVGKECGVRRGGGHHDRTDVGPWSPRPHRHRRH